MFTASMAFDLGEDVAALREMVHRWAQERVKPMAAGIDQGNVFPAELWREMGELGLLGITVEEAYGGAGMGYLAHTVAVEEVARASASVSLSYGAHSNLCVNQIRLNGTEAQKRRYLPGLISGEQVGALAMSEAGAGSDVVGMKLAAEMYSIFLVNHPESELREYAALREIQANIARFKGPEHDASGLLDARLLIQDFMRRYPETARREGVTEGLLVRIDESAAQKKLVTAKWYLSKKDETSARFTIDLLLERHPATAAARDSIDLMIDRGWIDPDAQPEDVSADEAAEANDPETPVPADDTP